MGAAPRHITRRITFSFEVSERQVRELDDVFSDKSRSIGRLRKRSEFATETIAVLTAGAFGPTFIGVKDDGTMSAFADDAVKRCLQLGQEFNANARFRVNNTGELGDTVVWGVIHSESPNGRGLRHRRNQSEGGLNQI